MAERRAFGAAGGSAGELDIDRVMRALLRLQCSQARKISRTAHFAYFCKIQHARCLPITQADDEFQLRQLFGMQLPGLTIIQFGRQPPDHLQVMTALESLPGSPTCSVHTRVRKRGKPD